LWAYISIPGNDGEANHVIGKSVQLAASRFSLIEDAGR
jgi:hypothetical protein